MPKKGYKQTEEHKEKQRKNALNRYKLNKSFGFQKGNIYGKINKGRKCPWASKNGFQKGHSINKNIPKSIEHKIKLSDVHKYNWKIGKEKINSGNFKKGYIPYNKNKTYEETFGKEKAKQLKKNLSDSHKGYKPTKEAIKKLKKYAKENPEVYIQKGITSTLKQGGKPSKAELKLKEYLKKNKINFIHQWKYKLGIADFYLPDTNLIIECDGNYWHSLPGYKERDERQTKWLINKNYIVLRLSSEEILTNDNILCLAKLNFNRRF